jgi:hypothetical protein
MKISLESITLNHRDEPMKLSKLKEVMSIEEVDISFPSM